MHFSLPEEFFPLANSSATDTLHKKEEVWWTLCETLFMLPVLEDLESKPGLKERIPEKIYKALSQDETQADFTSIQHVTLML